MSDHLDDLANTLSKLTTGSPYDVDSTQPERFKIDYIQEMLEDFELGDVSYENLKNNFSREFGQIMDIDLWLDTMVADGTYDKEFISRGRQEALESLRSVYG